MYESPIKNSLASSTPKSLSLHLSHYFFSVGDERPYNEQPKHKRSNEWDRSVSERWSDNLDRSDITFPSAEWIELFRWVPSPTTSALLTVWDRGATIAYILLSILLDAILWSSSCNRKFSSRSQPVSNEWRASLSSTVLFGQNDFHYCKP